MKSIRITHRDCALLRWINSVGFVSVDQVAEKLDVAKTTAYGRLSKLVGHHYLIHERIFHGAPGIYRTTQAGVSISGSNLPVMKKVPLSSYYHDLTMTSLSLKLVKQYEADFIPERELRHENGIDCFGKTGHLSDGILVMKDKRFAIEVELTKKSQGRREKILSYYKKDFSVSEVWYFCGNNDVFKAMEKMTGAYPILKIYHLYDVIAK